MKEAPITRSPHAYVPKKHYTEQEEAELYRTRLDESFKPYTVIDVITKVFHRALFLFQQRWGGLSAAAGYAKQKAKAMADIDTDIWK